MFGRENEITCLNKFLRAVVKFSGQKVTYTRRRPCFPGFRIVCRKRAVSPPQSNQNRTIFNYRQAVSVRQESTIARLLFPSVRKPVSFITRKRTRAMSENTRSSAFRKIDVDQFNENFKDDEQSEYQQPTAIPDESEITTMINQGRLAEALKSALKNAPLGSKNQQLRDNALNVVMQVLLATKLSQIDEVVAQLDVDMVDVLMKYIYKGFEKSTEKKSSHLLMWHEKAYALGGAGSIIRVLTDRKRV